MPEIDVLRLAATGVSLRMIADRLEVSERIAAQRLIDAIKASGRLAPDQEGAREIELVHLDMLRQAMVPAALRGDIPATRMLIRIHQARALLLGLTRMEHYPIDLDEEVSDLARIRAERDKRRAQA